MSKKMKFDDDDWEYEDKSDYRDQDTKRYDRKKQDIESARRAKNNEKNSYFLE
jgi:hypothetical protein